MKPTSIAVRGTIIELLSLHPTGLPWRDICWACGFASPYRALQEIERALHVMESEGLVQVDRPFPGAIPSWVRRGLQYVPPKGAPKPFLEPSLTAAMYSFGQSIRRAVERVLTGKEKGE
jgi:hypothetical protein